MKKIISIFINLMFIHILFAQGNLIGYVHDKNNKPIEFVTVRLLKDTALIASTITDSSGTYQFFNLKASLYKIFFSYIGIDKKDITAIITKDTAINITLEHVAEQLKNVYVTNKKPLFQKEADRFVFNVANTALIIGNTVWDVLDKTPLVKTQSGGNVYIENMQTATIYINDHKVQIGGEDLERLLRGIPSDNIIKIEVITIPSSKYDAGGGGIINIVMRKNQEEGLSGTASLTDKQAYYNSQSASLLLNYKKNKYKQSFQVSPSLGKTYDSYNNSIAYNNNPILKNETYNTQNTYSPDNSFYMKTSIDYDFNKKNYLGIIVDYQATNYTKAAEGTSSINKIVNDIIQNERDFTNNNTTGLSNYATTNINYEFDDEKHNSKHFEINLDYLYFNNKTNGTFYSVNNFSFIPDYANKTSQNQTIQNYSFSLDYSQKISKGASIETGIKYTATNTKNPFNFYLLNNNLWTLDTSNTNSFLYNENIAAAYFSLQQKLSSKIDYKLGLRFENTDIQTRQQTNNTTFPQNYNKLLPTGYINYNINDRNVLSLSYKTDFVRPRFSQLNPFRSYITKNFYSEGNPFLTPLISYATELSYTYKHAYTFLLDYEKIANIFSEAYSLINDTTLVDNRINYGYTNNYSFTSVVQQSIIKNKWEITFTGSITDLLQNALIAGIASKTNDIIYSLDLEQQFTKFLNSGYDISLNMNFQNKFVASNWVRKSFGRVGFGISRTIPKPNIRIAFYANDIFNTNTLKGSSRNPNFNFNLLSNYYQQSIRLSISKPFGKTKVRKVSDREVGNQEESRRVK